MITLTFTGLDRLVQGFQYNPQILERHIEGALKKSIAMVETESKRETPVRTGYLMTSIGGAAGFSFVRGSVAEVGTNVEYAGVVHETHRTKSRFMEKGAKASIDYITKSFKEALENYAREITTGI